MRRYVSYALISVALLTFVAWAVSQFIQPILPTSVNASLVLFIAVLIGVVGTLGQFKDIVEFFRSFAEQPNKVDNAVTGPVQVIYGNVTVNVTYIVQSALLEWADVSAAVMEPKVRVNERLVPRQAPPIPSHLTGRIAEIVTLKQILLQKSQTVGLVGLKGMGGVGKTTLAAALAHDSDIEREFSDGTLWAYVDRFRDIREILPQWINALNPSEPAIDSSNITQLLARFRLLTQTRRILIVLDGVDKENASQMQSIIKAIGPKCKVLITSRAVNVPGIQALVSLDMLPEHEALLLLEREIGRKLTAEERIVAREIVFLLGYHPLALKLAGAVLRETSTDLVEYIDKLRAEIGTAQTLGLDEAREHSVGRIRNTLDYIHNHLSAQEQSRFRQLSVFATENFDKKAALGVWHTDLFETENTLSNFVAVGLLTVKDGFYRMHPLVCEYVKELLSTSSQ